ncbi:hypothetical protein [Streptomyces chartreusis]|uniref:hypothetical protein n=1 Tax=Streptomyces chartreusis TaxID=1969 RepID=UPI0038002F75
MQAVRDTFFDSRRSDLRNGLWGGFDEIEAYALVRDGADLDAAGDDYIIVGKNTRTAEDTITMTCGRCRTSKKGQRSDLTAWVHFHAKECDGRAKRYFGKTPKDEITHRENSARFDKAKKQAQAEERKTKREHANCRYCNGTSWVTVTNGGRPTPLRCTGQKIEGVVPGVVEEKPSPTKPAKKTAAKKAAATKAAPRPKKPVKATPPANAAGTDHSNCARCHGNGTIPRQNTDGTWAGSQPCPGPDATATRPASAAITPQATPVRPAPRKATAARPDNAFAADLRQAQNNLAQDIKSHTTRPTQQTRAHVQKQDSPAKPRKATAATQRPGKAATKPATVSRPRPAGAAPAPHGTGGLPPGWTGGLIQTPPPAPGPADTARVPRKTAAKKEKPAGKTAVSAVQAGATRAKKTARVIKWVRKHPATAGLAAVLISTTALWRGIQAGGRLVARRWRQAAERRAEQRANARITQTAAATHARCQDCKGTGVIALHNADGTWAGSEPCSPAAVKRAAARRAAAAKR